MEDTRGAAHLMLRGAGVIAAAMIAGRAVGLIREVVLANVLGASELADSFVLSFAVPDFLSTIILAGAANATVVPMLVRAKIRGGDTAFAEKVNELFVVSLLAAAVISVALYSSAAVVVGVIIAPQSTFVRETTIALLHLTAWITLLHIPSGVLSESLNARRRFLIPSLGTLVFNTVTVLGLLEFARLRETAILGASIALGALARALSLVPANIPILRAVGAIKMTALRATMLEVAELGLPAVAAAAAFYVNALIGQYFALRVGPGATASLYYAVRIVEAPVSIASTALAIAIFPAVARYAVQRRDTELREIHRLGQHVALAGTLPVALLLAVVPREFVQLLLGRGAFDQIAVDLTTSALQILVLAVPFAAATALLVRLFQAHRDTRLPLFAAVAGVISNLLLQVTLNHDLGLARVAIALTVASAVNFLLLAGIGIRRGYVAPPEARDAYEFVPSLMGALAALVTFAATVALGRNLAETSAPAFTALGAVLAMAAYVTAHIACRSQVWRIVIGSPGQSGVSKAID